MPYHLIHIAFDACAGFESPSNDLRHAAHKMGQDAIRSSEKWQGPLSRWSSFPFLQIVQGCRPTHAIRARTSILVVGYFFVSNLPPFYSWLL